MAAVIIPDWSGSRLNKRSASTAANKCPPITGTGIGVFLKPQRLHLVSRRFE
jgi:hypothetical protein